MLNTTPPKPESPHDTSRSPTTTASTSSPALAASTTAAETAAIVPNAASNASTSATAASEQQPSAASSTSQSAAAAGTNNGSNNKRKKEIYRYDAPWNVYSMNWSVRPASRHRIVVSSFIENFGNELRLLTLDEERGEFDVLATCEHPYPATGLQWIPDTTGTLADLFASSGEFLRLWLVVPDSKEIKMECVLDNNISSQFCAPLTSFDWNEVDPTLIGTSSIDTTCTIWNLEVAKPTATVSHSASGSVKTQLIAHDKEVYDIAFSRAGGGRDMFASVGADGSVRMFDLRHLEHSTIIYEDAHHRPLLRLAWNKQDSNYLSTFALDSEEIIVLDVRVPCTPVARLNNHKGFVNGMAWAPHSSCHICTAADDHQALIWDIQQASAPPRTIEDPILAYNAQGPINQIQWSACAPDWIAICFNKSLEMLRV